MVRGTREKPDSNLFRFLTLLVARKQPEKRRANVKGHPEQKAEPHTSIKFHSTHLIHHFRSVLSQFRAKMIPEHTTKDKELLVVCL